MTGRRITKEAAFRLVVFGVMVAALLTGCKGSRDGDGTASSPGRGNDSSGEESVQPPPEPGAIPGTGDEPDAGTRPQNPPD